MSKKEDLRVLKTRASLYRGLLELMKTKTFESIKVSEICDISMINRSTFYDHFNDKYELLQSSMNSVREELLASIDVDQSITNIRDYYLLILKGLLAHIDKNKSFYSSIVKINNNSIARDMMTNALLDSISSEIDINYINKTSIPTRTFVLFYSSGIINVIIDSLIDNSNFNVNRLYQYFEHLIPNIDTIQYAK